MEFRSFLASLGDSESSDEVVLMDDESSPSETETNDYDEEESAEEYEVEAIRDDRIVNGKRQFLLKWKGFPDSENTWEDEKNLNCPQLIKEYLKKKTKPQSVLPAPEYKAPQKISTLFKLTQPKPIKSASEDIEKVIRSRRNSKGWFYTVRLKDSTTTEIHSALLKKICPDFVLDYLESKISKASLRP